MVGASPAAAPLDVGVVGLGPIGNLHANLYADMPEVRLVGVCDILPERARAAADRLGVRAYTSTQRMLDELHPRLVSVATGRCLTRK